MTAALVLGAVVAGLGVIGAQVALLWWTVRWARSESKGVASAIAAQNRIRETLQKQIDGLAEAVKDRDHALDELRDHAARAGRRLDEVRAQRDQALELARQTAGDHPELVADSIRADLERLRALADEEMP